VLLGSKGRRLRAFSQPALAHESNLFACDGVGVVQARRSGRVL